MPDLNVTIAETEENVTIADPALVTVSGSQVTETVTVTGGGESITVADTSDTVTVAQSPDVVTVVSESVSVITIGIEGPAGPQGEQGEPGPVSSVGITAPAAGITVSGSPITGSGSMTLALANDLAGVEAITGNGLATRTADDTWTTRTLTGTTDSITVTNGNGVSGNPTFAVASTYPGQSSIVTLGTVTTGTWSADTIAVSRGGTGQTSFVDGQLLIGNSTGNTLTKATLTAGANVTITNGSGSITIAASGGGSGTVTSVDIAAPAAGITASGGPVTGAGSITLALANDLAAVEGLTGTGVAARTTDDTWALRTITGTADKITVTNGSGAAGNPTLTIASTYVGQTSITTLGTVATGTWNATTLGVAYGGTGQTSYTDGQLLIGNTTGNTLAKGTLTAPAAGFTIAGGAGSITFALSNDLAAVEGLSSTGVVVRTASDTWTTRSIAGTSGYIDVTNGDGVSGNPTVTISSTYAGQNTIVTVGTITSGTWQGSIIGSAYGGTGNGFTKFSGPTTSEKTFTLPNASATILTTNAAVTAAQGGTGIASYTVGDLLYASGATALSKLADVATGNALISGGVGAAPAYGKIGLTTHVSGTLAESSGGTGETSYTDGQLLIGNSSGGLTKATITAGSNISITNGDGSITIAASGLGSGTVTSVDVAGPAAGITSSGGPITTSGTITLALANDLAAVEGLSSTGVVVRSASETWVTRTITGTADKITVSDGSGVSGNPTLTIASTYIGQTSITTLGTVATGTWQGTAVGVAYGGTGQTSYTNGQLLIGNTTGNTLTKATLTAPAAGISITNGTGSITFGLANDLSALEGLTGTGVACRTTDDTWALRTISGTTNRITLTDGDGVSGSPVVDISASYVGQNTITTLGTITTGTWTATTIGVAYGGTGQTSYTDGQLLIGNSTGNTLAKGTLTAPAAGITITGGSGTITFALADDLAGLESLASTGMVVRSASNTYTTRTVTGTADKITVSDGDGVSGNPTLTIAATYVGQNTITTLGTIATGTWTGTTIGVAYGGTGQTSYTNGQLLIGNTTGNTLTKATLTAPAAGISITNGTGSITFGLANDLSAVEGLSSTGLAARTASDTWAVRTLTGTTDELDVADGNGVSGNPTVSLADTAAGALHLFRYLNCS